MKTITSEVMETGEKKDVWPRILTFVFGSEENREGCIHLERQLDRKHGPFITRSYSEM